MPATIPSLLSLQAQINALNISQGDFTPTLSNLSGISGTPTVNYARYETQGVMVKCYANLTIDASSSDVSFDVGSLPVTPNFTANTQANYITGNIAGDPPTVADGNMPSYKSNPSDGTVTASMNVTTGAGTYTVDIAFIYEVQP